MKYKDKIVLQTYISVDLYEELQKRAKALEVPLSSYVRLLLIGALSNENNKGTNSGITEFCGKSKG